MRQYLKDILPKLGRFSKKLDELTNLENHQWVLLDELGLHKIVYIFRDNNQLLLSKNGIINVNHWEYLNSNTLMITINDTNYLCKNAFFDEYILVLKIDGNEGFITLINETKLDFEVNSESDVLFLFERYKNQEFFIESDDELYKLLKDESNRVKLELNFEQIKKYFPIKNTFTNKGKTVDVFSYNTYYPSYGDRVFLFGKKLENGRYKTGFLKYITVKNGIIVR